MRLIWLTFLFGVLQPAIADGPKERLPLKIVTLTEAKSIEPVISMVSQAYSNLNIKTEIVHLPAKRALIEAQKNTWVDGELVRIDSAKDQLPNYYKIPVKLMEIDVAIYSNLPKSTMFSWKNLTNYKIASMRGLIHLEQKMAIHNLDNIKLVTRAEQLFKLLEANRVDLVILPKPIGDSFILANGNYNFNEAVLETVSLYHYIHQRHSALVDPLTSEFTKLSLKH